MDTKEYFRQYRLANKEKIYENHKRWRNKNKDFIKQYNAEYYKDNKKKLINYVINWQKNTPTPKYKTRRLAINLARSIKLTKCEDCGSIENLCRHHSNYSKPLEVTILCRSCHQDWHKQFLPIYPVLTLSK